jgi:hypothetical protein
MTGFDELQLYINLNKLLSLRLHLRMPKFPLILLVFRETRVPHNAVS